MSFNRSADLFYREVIPVLSFDIIFKKWGKCLIKWFPYVTVVGIFLQRTGFNEGCVYKFKSLAVVFLHLLDFLKEIIEGICQLTACLICVIDSLTATIKLEVLAVDDESKSEFRLKHRQCLENVHGAFPGKYRIECKLI